MIGDRQVGLAIVVERRILKVVLRKIANEVADELDSIVLVIGQVVGIARLDGVGACPALRERRPHR